MAVEGSFSCFGLFFFISERERERMKRGDVHEADGEKKRQLEKVFHLVDLFGKNLEHSY